MPGHARDLSCTQRLGVAAALNWQDAELDPLALADTLTVDPPTTDHYAICDNMANAAPRP